MDAPVQFDASDLDKLSATDKQELQQFINAEAHRTHIREKTHDLTAMCWKKCVTGPIKSNALDKGEQACLTSCVDRFLDISTLAVRHLQQQSQNHR